jgi:6-phosphofructokinase
VMDRYVADVKAVHDRLGRCVVAVSEGVHDEAGRLIASDEAKPVERDAHGNVQLSGSGALAELLCAVIKARLGINRVRGDTFGYLQRSFFGCVSEVDQREARDVGEKAVQFAMSGIGDGSVTIRRVGSYAVDYRLAPLAEIAGKTRLMDDAFIAGGANDVTAAFNDYLRPLLGSGMPDAGRLQAPAVPRASGT